MNTELLENMSLRCSDCGGIFVFSKGEYDYYKSKQLTIPPKRCPSCRQKRKSSIVPDNGMREGNRDDRNKHDS